LTFRIADSFTEALDRLTADERDAAKVAAFDMQRNPANPGMQFHRVKNAKDPNFWSVRVTRDLRLIVHRTNDSLLACYIDHHDAAYAWAERRKLERHPRTGAAQLVVIRERVEEVVKRVVVPVFEEEPKSARLPFEGIEDETLLLYGVPPEWLQDVRNATEETLLDVAEHLPSEAAEALVQLAVGETPTPPMQTAPEEDPFAHPDAQRRFRAIEGIEELKAALDAPWERWIVFLHPVQRDLVERSFNGPARVSGSAGTGKSVVALHRAVHLARRDDDARVLLATFSDPLASNLRNRLRLLIKDRPRLAERIHVDTLEGVAGRLHRARIGGHQRVVDDATLRDMIAEADREVGGSRFTPGFLYVEWRDVVDAWQLRDWESYRDVARAGRRARLAQSHRVQSWQVFELVRERLAEAGLTTRATTYAELACAFGSGASTPYDHVVLDEAQDASVAQLRFLGRIAGDRPDGLFFAGDLGQRIFQAPFSWRSVSVDVRGRSRTLKVNYRTSQQIRELADRLLDDQIDDVDGETEVRRGTISVFEGPHPIVHRFADANEEVQAVGAWLRDRLEADVAPAAVGVFVRSEAQLPRARQAVQLAGIVDRGGSSNGDVTIATMHQAKGLEFRLVAVMACDEDVIPDPDRLADASDMVAMEEAHELERHLLYVALTRARDELHVSGVVPGSDYLDDLQILRNAPRHG
jgi:mRNA-degrading endonuclease RelE of RelBE toxin-antitoxin system